MHFGKLCRFSFTETSAKHETAFSTCHQKDDLSLYCKDLGLLGRLEKGRST